METMYLVAGLALAGLVGIAAAFYFSIRSGGGAGRRLRSAKPGRAGAGRRPGGRGHGTAGADWPEENARRSAHGGRPAKAGRGANAPSAPSRNYQDAASTGPNPVLDFGDPALAGSRRRAPAESGGPGELGGLGDVQATDPRLDAVRPDNSQPGESRVNGSRVGDSRPGSRSAARLSREAHTARGPAKADRPRRRVGFRKGADVDEELWPAEAFGGVSDEQFWDDLASDKPLATTARTAQQDPGPKSRLLDAGSSGDTQVVQAMGQDRSRDDRGRGDERARGEGRRGTGSGMYPDSRPGPDPAAERTAIQPSYAATQPVRSMTPQVPGATQPVQTSASLGSGQPGSAAGNARPMSTSSQPPATATQPTETRGRRRASSIDDEDPLTSAAFSLRASGPVDGSSRRSRDATRDQYGEPRAGGSRSGGPGSGVGAGSGSGSVYGAASPYTYSGTSYGDPASVTQATASTPPYGENFGYGSGSPAAQADGPRRPDGTRSHGRPDGNGEGTRAARRAVPQNGYQGTGSYHGSGSYEGSGSSRGTASYPTASYPAGGYVPGSGQGTGYQGTGYQSGPYPGGGYQPGGYQGNGRQDNGHRAPYDPREDYRRLSHPR